MHVGHLHSVFDQIKGEEPEELKDEEGKEI